MKLSRDYKEINKKLSDCEIWIIVGLLCSGEYRISSSIKCINCNMKEAKSDGMKGARQVPNF